LPKEDVEIRRRQEENIKMDLGESYVEVLTRLYWFSMERNFGTVMKLWVPYKQVIP